jgi:23S rRNA (guanosine2251-2'-O)-methyltransferase
VRESLYGRHAVQEALKARRRQFFRLLIAESVRESEVVREVLELAQSLRVPVQRVPRRELDWVGEINHQGMLLEASGYPYASVDDLFAAAQRQQLPALLLVVDLVQDPQNLGSLLRSADAAGAHGAIIQERRAAGVTPAAVHASAGAAEHLHVALVTNLADTISQLRERDVWIAGLESVPGARPYSEADLTAPIALVVGSEGEGLRRLVRERCDYLLHLPMLGHVSSLNAAVAGSVVLYEAQRQRAAARAQSRLTPPTTGV